MSRSTDFFNVAQTALNKMLVIAGYFMHYRMCLRGNFNILVYEGDKMQNKNIPLLCPGVREVFLPSTALSTNNQPQPKTHSSHTIHAQQVNTYLSLQAAKPPSAFCLKTVPGQIACRNRTLNQRRFLKCNLLNFACRFSNRSIDWEPNF